MLGLRRVPEQCEYLLKLSVGRMCPCKNRRTAFCKRNTPLEGDLAARGVRKSGWPFRSPLRGVKSKDGYSFDAEGGATSDIASRWRAASSNRFLRSSSASRLLRLWRGSQAAVEHFHSVRFTKHPHAAHPFQKVLRSKLRSDILDRSGSIQRRQESTQPGRVSWKSDLPEHGQWP